MDECLEEEMDRWTRDGCRERGRWRDGRMKDDGGRKRKGREVWKGGWREG